MCVLSPLLFSSTRAIWLLSSSSRVWACVIWFPRMCVLICISVASVCSSVLLVFMAAPSLSSHFLPQITAAEQQPVSRAAAAAVTVSSADPSWKLHAGSVAATASTASTASTALAEWSLRFHSRARCAPPPSLPPFTYPRTCSFH